MPPSVLQRSAAYESDPADFLDQALYLARAAALAYHDDARAIAHELAVANVTAFPDPALQPLPNTQGFWFRHDGIACLVFRGSANRRHWLSNFKVLPPARPNHDWGRVHRGFAASFQSIIPSVMKPFAAAAREARIVWLAGHSLGGALAVHAAAWLRIHAGLQPHLRTYGQPMPGFAEFRTRFETELPGRLIRFINQSDFVPRLPGVGYAHCGQPKTITAGLTLERLTHTAAEPPSLADAEPPPATESEFDNFIHQLESAPDTAETFQPEGVIFERMPWAADHGCDRYVANLQAIRQALA